MDERLKQYLQECRKKGLSWEQVGHVMEGSNYPAETISEAKIWFEHPNGVAESAAEVKSVNPIKPKKKLGFLGFLLVLLVILVLIAGGGYGAVYMVATQKLTLPNQNWQKQTEKIAMSLPGVPKNPKLILEMVEEAHKKVSKSSFEISVSGQLDAAEIESLLGSKAIDLQIKGFSDVSNTNNPRFFMNLMLGREIELELRKPDKMMYAKVNKFPVAIYAFLGLDPIKINPLWENWIGVDVSRPDTSARKVLEEAISGQHKQPEASQAAQDILDKVMMEEILPSVVVTEEENSYKMVFSATPEQVNRIVRELDKKESDLKTNPSDILKRLSVQVWVDKQAMLLTEMRILGSIELDKSWFENSSSLRPVLAMTSEKQRADFAIVIKLSDFGKDMPIIKPDKYLSPEEFLSEFVRLEPGGIYSALLKATPSANARSEF